MEDFQRDRGDIPRVSVMRTEAELWVNGRRTILAKTLGRIPIETGVPGLLEQ